MTKDSSDRVSYAIAYDKTKQLVIVYPQWRGQRPNFQQIGEYKPENPRANLEEYAQDLGEAIGQAMLRVGQEIDPYKITITPLDGTADIVAKDFGGPIQRVPVEDQVPVSGDTTVAMATAEEQENGTPEDVPTQATKELNKAEMAAQREKPAKQATKKATKKVTKKTTK